MRAHRLIKVKSKVLFLICLFVFCQVLGALLPPLCLVSSLHLAAYLDRYFSLFFLGKATISTFS